VSGGRVLVLLVLLSTGLLAGCASHSPHRDSGGGAPHTVTRTFSAYDAHGDLTVHVADVARGRCWTASIAVPGVRGAYRCIAGNAILDPCFAPATPSSPVEVACLADPWSDAEVLQVTGALPSAGAGADTGPRPWALQLGNGVRCVAATGTVPAIGGVDLGYHCRGGSNAAVHDATAALVTADYAAAGAHTLRRVSVATIWRV
jgi:hypothetical protein